MNQISVIPKINHDKFMARVLMDDYGIEKPIAISVTARRNDGEYMTQILTYPTAGVDYAGNIPIYFFDMSRSHVAQIISVFINGEEIRTYYNNVDGLDGVQARYDDSLCRYQKGPNINDIRLSCQIVDTHDPKVLMVMDESEWGLLEDRKAIIEIITPGRKEPSVFFLGKNQVNVFTSLTLGLNCHENGGLEYLDLPDGIYDITLKGSPSYYSFNRKFLKTDILRRRMDRLWIKTNVLCEHEDKGLLDKIKELEYLMAVTEANVRLGNIKEAHDIIDRINDLLDMANNCINC